MSETSILNIPPETLVRIIDVGRRLNSTTDMDVLLQQIIHEAADLLNAEGISLLLFDERTRELRFKAAVGEASALLVNQVVPLKGSIAGEIYQRNEPLIVDDVQSNAGWNPDYDAAADFQTQAILGVPLHDSSSRAVGVLEAINKRDGRFHSADVVVLSTFADLAGVAITKAQLFEELREAYSQLNELDQLKSNFIAVASHELRTPLNVIMGYVSFLREQAHESQVVQLDQTMKAAMQLRKLIENMVNLQYVGASDEQLDFETINLVPLLRLVVSEREESALAKNQSIHLHLPSRSLKIRAVPDMLKLIVDNLVSNAIKFSPAGGRVDVGAARRDDEIWIYVRDSGPGIPADQLKRIFDRFYQIEPHLRRQHEGLGLGLAIVRELVDRHGGRVWAQSEPGHGSEFFVVLPANPTPPPPS